MELGGYKARATAKIERGSGGSRAERGAKRNFLRVRWEGLSGWPLSDGAG
jgi:hypothetical protein